MPVTPGGRTNVTGSVSIRCPECSCSVVDEVSTGPMYQEITGFYNGWADWGERYLDDMRVTHLQCRDCAFTYLNCDQERYPNDLFEFFRERGWLDLPRDEDRIDESNGVSWEV